MTLIIHIISRDTLKHEKKPNIRPTDLFLRYVVLHFMKHYIITLISNVYM